MADFDAQRTPEGALLVGNAEELVQLVEKLREQTRTRGVTVAQLAIA